ncbi:MAG: ABC transporter ATP-binding protein [Proteobacteria bacterium]|nr:ABC transporter ATP-binding protein [Pseudomonadota bacterium]
MLVLNAVTRTTHRHAVLKEITMSVPSGGFVSVLGPTGSGKTSLLRAIMGLDLIDSGEIRFDENLLARPKENIIAPERRGFSLVFEKITLLPFMNAEENIVVGSRPTDESGRTRLEEILSLLRLDSLRERSVQNLSGGEQQLVALARSLFVKPRLLLLDEPFRNIDRPLRDRLIPALMEYLKERGVTVILVTHDRDEAFFFSQKIFLLRDGELVCGDTPYELYNNPKGDWDAQLLGECNLLPIEVAGDLLDFEPSGGHVKWIVVRPEHLEVYPDPPHNVTLKEIRFWGFYKTLEFQIKQDMNIMVKVAVDEEFVKDQGYSLRLKNRTFAKELSSRSGNTGSKKP